MKLKEIKPGMVIHCKTQEEPIEQFTGLELANIVVALERLQYYEDLKEKGLLIELPCNVGDSVYFIKAYLSYCKEPIEEKVDRIIIANLVTFKTENRTFCLNDIGTKLFLTKSEAEQALEASQHPTVAKIKTAKENCGEDSDCDSCDCYMPDDCKLNHLTDAEKRLLTNKEQALAERQG